jgi:uncharacterized protein YggE
VNAAMTITVNERVSAMLKPDVLRGSFGFEEQGRDANAIKGHLNEIVAEVKRIDPNGRYCHGGGYNLSPRYSYKEQKQEFIGYSGNLNFSCAFAGIDQYNAVSAAIDKVSAPSVRKNQGELAWGVSAAQERMIQNGLRLEALRRADGQAKAFSAETGMACEVASVNFGELPVVIPMRVRGAAMMASVPTESPIQSDLESVLNATVGYTCSKRVP